MIYIGTGVIEIDVGLMAFGSKQWRTRSCIAAFLEVDMDRINLTEKFSLFEEFWNPRIVASLNDSYVKLVKLKGEFIWHHHELEDELFFVINGRLLIEFRDRNLWLNPGELVVIPRGVEHRPVAEEEVQVILIEPKTTLNTGEVGGERTVDARWI